MDHDVETTAAATAPIPNKKQHRKVRINVHDQDKFAEVLREFKQRRADDNVEVNLSADHDRIMDEVFEHYPELMAPEFFALFPEQKSSLLMSDIGEVNPGRFFQLRYRRR